MSTWTHYIQGTHHSDTGWRVALANDGIGSWYAEQPATRRRIGPFTSADAAMQEADCRDEPRQRDLFDRLGDPRP